MQKTTSVSIGGRAFTCDQQAYEVIQKYLARCARKLAENPDKEEILSDIERSIADHLKESLKSDVVNEEIAQHTIEAIGEVDNDGLETDETEKSDDSISEMFKNTWRRIKNIEPDKSHRIVLGTSAGIAREFSIDPIWIRLLFVILTFAQGSGIIVYLLLSFVIYNKDRTAQTASELLRGAERTIKSRPYEKFLRKSFKLIWIAFRVAVATVGLVIFMAASIALMSLLFLLITDPSRVSILGAYRDWLQFIWIATVGLSVILPGFLIMILAMRWKKSLKAAGVFAFIWLGALIIAGASSIANVPRLRSWAIDNKIRTNFVYVYTVNDRVVDVCMSLTGMCANTNQYVYADNGVCSYPQYDTYRKDQYLFPVSSYYSQWIPKSDVLKQPVTEAEFCEQVEKVQAKYPSDHFTVLFGNRPLNEISMWQVDQDGTTIMQPSYFFDYMIDEF